MYGHYRTVKTTVQRFRKWGVPGGIILSPSSNEYWNSWWSGSRGSTRKTKPAKYRPKKKVTKNKGGKKEDCCTTVKKQIKRINKRLSEGETTFDFRQRIPDKIDKPVNQNYTSPEKFYFGLDSITQVMSKLQFWDDATQLFVTRDVTSVGDQHKINIDYVKSTLILKNNYQVPVKLEIYLVYPKTDTNTFPHTFYDNGIVDKVVDTATMLPNNDLLKLTDSNDFTTNWRIKKTWKKTLQPGQFLQASNTEKDITYDPTSAGTLKFQKRHKSHMFIARVHGSAVGVAHDSTGAVVGQVRAGLDVQWQQNVLCKYDGGMNGHRIYIDNQSGNVGNGGLTGVTYVSDNQAMTHT